VLITDVASDNAGPGALVEADHRQPLKATGAEVIGDSARSAAHAFDFHRTTEDPHLPRCGTRILAVVDRAPVIPRKRLEAARTPIAAVTLALVVGALVPVASTAEALQPALIAAIAAVLAAPIGARAVRRELDLFEPVVIFGAVWGLMFVVRPLVILVTDQTLLRGRYNVEEGITDALVVGLVSALAFHVAYWVSIRRPKLRRQYVRRGPPAAWAIVLPATIGFGVMGALAGSTITEAAAGASVAYEYLAPLLTIPVVALLLRRGNTVLACVLLAVSVLGFLGLGKRAYVIWPLSTAFVYWYMAKRRRPRFALMAAIVVFAILPVFTVLEVAREQGSTPVAALSQPETRDPGAAVERFSEGDTTAMFLALALQMQTEGPTWQQRPGYWVYSTPTRWIPRVLWPSKPLGSAEYLYSLYFPQLYGRAKGSTAFTLASEFYFDLGMVGVALGLAGVGWLCGALWLWVKSRQDDPWTWVLYAPVFGVATILFRGDVGLASGLALFVFGPLILARWTAKPVPPPGQTESS